MNNSNFAVVGKKGKIAIPDEVKNKLNLTAGTSLNVEITKSGSIILTPTVSKEKQIKSWVEDILNEIDRAEYDYELCFDRHNRVTICAAVDIYDTSDISTGVAICSPNDTFDYNMGKCIAFCRCFNHTIPNFIFED